MIIITPRPYSQHLERRQAFGTRGYDTTGGAKLGQGRGEGNPALGAFSPCRYGNDVIEEVMNTGETEMIKRRTASEIIGFHLGWDIGEVSDYRYQPTRFSSPSIYAMGDGYFAAPSGNIPPKNMAGEWREVSEHYGRKVFFLQCAA